MHQSAESEGLSSVNARNRMYGVVTVKGSMRGVGVWEEGGLHPLL